MKTGVKFDTASSGEAALEMMSAAKTGGQQYNVCIIDWKMPGLNGVETTSKIRSVYGNDTVIIIASAYDYSVIYNKSKSVGVDRFISKPLFPSTVSNMLNSLLGIDREEVAKSKLSHCFKDKRVLIAEDNELNRIVARGFLQKADIACDIAEDGKKALDMFIASAPEKYDAILMDMEMPVMDGIEATKAIRASNHKDANTIPILDMTANAFTGDISRCLQCGMNDHIAKPIVYNILVETLDKAFSKGER